MGEFFAAELTARQVISHYSAEEWEIFVDELVEGISSDKGYLSVKGMGGPGDLGIDVAGFKTTHGLESHWDGYQCKHYAAPLSPALAWVEIMKIFRAVVAGECVLPDAYIFVAPKGVGLGLNKLFSQPSKAKSAFVNWLQGYTPKPKMSAAERRKVNTLVNQTDFGRFNAMQPRQIITLHANTRYHSIRFSVPLPDRAHAPQVVPTEFGEDEGRYVDQLVAAYQQRHPTDALTRESIADHPEKGNHFRRQRQAFFRAETLRMYARDSTPEGTFEALQSDLHTGVIEVAESDHVDGFAKIQSVLSASGTIDLTNHRLIERADQEDRKGICHQLVNSSLLTWVEN